MSNSDDDKTVELDEFEPLASNISTPPPTHHPPTPESQRKMNKYYNTTKKLTSIAHKLKPNNVDRLFRLYGRFTHTQRRVLLNPKTPLHRIIRLIRIVDKTEKHKTKLRMINYGSTRKTIKSSHHRKHL